MENGKKSSGSDLDLIVRNGRIVTASEVLALGAELGVKDGKIHCIGQGLEAGPETEVVDAQGAYITPGGVDSHVHIQQDNTPTGDTWETGSRSAIAGGNTTIIAFATQKRQEPGIWPALEAYHAKATGNSYCDYGFHLILTNPNETVLEKELPSLLDAGVSSVKLYMTYEPMKLGDSDLFNIMMKTRSLGITTMIHAENTDIIEQITKRLANRGNTGTFFHSVARPQIAESEATYRAISLAEVTDTPILLVHMSAPAAVQHVREAQARLLPVHAETERLRSGPEDFEGAKGICAPPLRHDARDLEAIWMGLAAGTFTVVSSDHAPATFDHACGKMSGLVVTDGNDGNGKARHGDFRHVPNGLPGIETRLPLLYDRTFDSTRPGGGVGDDDKIRIPLTRFVELTSTNPAKLYGLAGRKGSLLPGHDADIVIWYPEEPPLVAVSEADGPLSSGSANAAKLNNKVTITNSMLHHRIDYTPFEGIEVRNWPRWVFLRGKRVWDRDGGQVIGGKGDGVFLKRGKSNILTGQMGRTGVGMMKGEQSYWM
ncbi:Dihydropyrimidinase [Apiospora marii]|uniref:dihydropyrimidinase n=1 Tax=Apiospora marii TaxID=335849 RepID=A0ABR1RLX9_9PEZI